MRVAIGWDASSRIRIIDRAIPDAVAGALVPVLAPEETSSASP